MKPFNFGDCLIEFGFEEFLQTLVFRSFKRDRTILTIDDIHNRIDYEFKDNDGEEIYFVFETIPQNKKETEFFLKLIKK